MSGDKNHHFFYLGDIGEICSYKAYGICMLELDWI